MSRAVRTLEDRFWDLVKIPPDVMTGCWEWIGCKNAKGYGKFSYPTAKMAHRFALMSVGRPVSKGFHVDHLCLNTSCVNPSHLEEVTPTENTRRSSAAKLTPARVVWLRAARVAGCPVNKIAKTLGVVPSCVSDVLSGRYWRDV